MCVCVCSDGRESGECIESMSLVQVSNVGIGKG